MKFACQDKLLPGNTYAEKYVNAKKAGFDGVEINASAQLPLVQRIDEIKQAVSASGIVPSSVCGGYRGWLGHFEKEMRDAAIEDMKSILSAMAEIGAQGLVIPAAYGMFSRKLPPFTPPRGEQEDRQILVEGLSILGEAAEAHNVRVFLEPLNRYEDHMINTVSQAADIIKEVGHRSISVMLDFFHANIEEEDISQTIYDYGKSIRHVHLADSNRLQPGKGHTDFAKGIRALKETGFDGYCALECNVRGDGLAPLIDTLSFLKSI